jgi:hypothetical protein
MDGAVRPSSLMVIVPDLFDRIFLPGFLYLGLCDRVAVLIYHPGYPIRRNANLKWIEKSKQENYEHDWNPKSPNEVFH